MHTPGATGMDQGQGMAAAVELAVKAWLTGGTWIDGQGRGY